jgi:hypothetical protein
MDRNSFMYGHSGMDQIVESALEVVEFKIVKPKILKQGGRVSREFLQSTKPMLDSFHYKLSDSFRNVEAEEPAKAVPPASLMNSVKVKPHAQYGLSRLQEQSKAKNSLIKQKQMTGHMGQKFLQKLIEMQRRKERTKSVEPSRPVPLQKAEK